jgi:hypothetical protein
MDGIVVLPYSSTDYLANRAWGMSVKDGIVVFTYLLEMNVVMVDRQLFFHDVAPAAGAFNDDKTPESQAYDADDHGRHQELAATVDVASDGLTGPHKVRHGDIGP